MLLFHKNTQTKRKRISLLFLFETKNLLFITTKMGPGQVLILTRDKKAILAL